MVVSEGVVDTDFWIEDVVFLEAVEKSTVASKAEVEPLVGTEYTVVPEAVGEAMVVLEPVVVSLVNTVVGTDVFIEGVVLSEAIMQAILDTDAVTVSVGIVVAMECTNPVVIAEVLVETMVVSEAALAALAFLRICGEDHGSLGWLCS